MLKPIGRDTPPIPAPSTDRRNRIDRRCLLRTLVGAGIAGLAGCLGDDGDGSGDDGTGGDDVDGSDDTDEPTDGEDAPETSEGDGEGGSDDEPAGTDTDDEDEAVHPADLEIDPEDGWGEPYDGVEVPDEPGRAVLVIDGERFELEGSCQGGEVHADDEDEERELRAEHGHFVFVGTFHPTGDEGFAAVVSRIVGIERISGTSDGSRTVAEFDQFALGGGDSAAGYRFLRYGDGETESVEDDGITGADEPFVRIDPSGVITAVGQLERVESGVDPEADDVPLGQFEFGARCQADWDEEWGEQ